MTGNALIHALVIGASVGLLGRFVLPGRDAAPAWLAIAVGLGAALLGTIIARVAGVDVAAPSVLRLAVQAGFAGAAVTLAVVTARHTPGPTRRSSRRLRATGDPSTPADQEGNRP